MKHEIIVEKLSEYRDGALSAAERLEVSRHVSDCDDCAAVLADWERLTKIFFRRSPLPAPVATEAFVARVMARLPEAAPEPFAWLFGRWLVPALSVSFAILVLSFQAYPHFDQSDPAGALLTADSERGVSLIQPSASADVLGVDGEDR